MNKRVQIRVQGQVQGVGYRYYVAHVAKEMGIVGTVRNSADGSVEAIGEGDEAALNQFAENVATGPHTAHVTDAISSWTDATGEFQDFQAVG